MLVRPIADRPGARPVLDGHGAAGQGRGRPGRASVLPPFFNDIAPARARGLTVEGDDLLHWQYAPAVQRAVELLRQPGT